VYHAPPGLSKAGTWDYGSVKVSGHRSQSPQNQRKDWSDGLRVGYQLVLNLKAAPDTRHARGKQSELWVLLTILCTARISERKTVWGID
jgi:hypothetical protein